MKRMLCAIACVINALVAVHIGLCALGFNIVGRLGMEDSMMQDSMMVEGKVKYIMIIIGISGVIALVAHIHCWMSSCSTAGCK